MRLSRKTFLGNMKKSEASQHTAVAAWMRNFLKKHHSVAVEVKHTRGKNSLPFSALEVHQRDALMAVHGTGLVFKIPDGGYQKLPFDLFGMARSLSFVAVRYPKFIAIIDIQRWVLEEMKSERKSLTDARAIEIATDVIDFG